MFRYASLFITLTFLSCQDAEKDTKEGVACPAGELIVPTDKFNVTPIPMRIA